MASSWLAPLVTSLPPNGSIDVPAVLGGRSVQPGVPVVDCVGATSDEAAIPREAKPGGTVMVVVSMSGRCSACGTAAS
jgi:hypothetical protein